MLLLACLFLVACLPTPTEEIVQNRAEGSLETIIYATMQPTTVVEMELPNGVSASPVSVDANDTEPVAAPETEDVKQFAPRSAMRTIEWQETFTANAAMDEIHVTLDAEVEYPENGSGAVAVVKFGLPPEAEIRSLIAYFLGDGPLYLADRTKTKSYYKATMERCTAALETETDETMRQQWELLLKRTSQQYAEAPEDTEPAPWDGRVDGGIDLMAPNGDGSYRYLSVSLHGVAYRATLDAPQYQSRTRQTTPQTERERSAWTDAANVLRTLGLDAVPWAIAEQEKTVRAFGEETHEDAVVLWCSPMRFGLPCTDVYVFHGYEGAEPESEPSYTTTFPQESLQLVMENGKVMTYRHNYASVVQSVENDAAPLLPFEEIQQKFREWLPRTMYVLKGDPLTICIDTVQLTMRRVPLPDSGDELATKTYWLLPVWEFIGSVRSEKATYPIETVCVLRLNALDGSVTE